MPLLTGLNEEIPVFYKQSLDFLKVAVPGVIGMQAES